MELNLDKNIPSGLSSLPKKENNKIYILVPLIIFFLIIIFAFFYGRGIFLKKEPAVNLQPMLEYTKTDLPTDKLPEVFPKDMIQEKDPMILENYEAKNLDGWQTQHTLKYITKKSVAENFEAYRKYFNENQWAILNRELENDFFNMYVAKKYDKISITQTFNQENNIQIIDLTLVHFQSKNSASTTSQNVN